MLAADPDLVALMLRTIFLAKCDFQDITIYFTEYPFDITHPDMEPVKFHPLGGRIEMDSYPSFAIIVVQLKRVNSTSECVCSNGGTYSEGCW